MGALRLMANIASSATTASWGSTGPRADASPAGRSRGILTSMETIWTKAAKAIGNRCRMTPVAAVFLLAVTSCEAPSRLPETQPDIGFGHFIENDVVLVVEEELARLEGDDPRAMLGSAGAVLPIASGYVVADAMKNEIVILDQQLNPVRRVGGEGEEPGEYRYPAALAGNGKIVAVSDPYLQRVQFLSQMGDLLQTVELTHQANDLAFHPQMGLLTTLQRGLWWTLSRPADHYLEASTTRSSFAPIPIEFASEAFGPRFNHRVAVSADGSVHVLDNEHLVLVSYTADGHLTGGAYLPRDLRNAVLEAVAEERRKNWAILAMTPIAGLSSLPDGSLFISTGYKTIRGFVLDPETREAIPIVVRDSERESRIMSFDGKHAVLANNQWDLSLHRVIGIR